MAKKPGDKIEKKVKDPVSEMRIFADGVRKQKAKEIIYQNYQIPQPSKMDFYSDKPNNNTFLLLKIKERGGTLNGVDIDEKLHDELNKTQLTNELNDKLKTVTHVPKQKWNEPQTTAQQIGWLADHPFQQNSKFVKKRVGCDETHYADGYYTMKHVSLFSNHKKK